MTELEAWKQIAHDLCSLVADGTARTPFTTTDDRLLWAARRDRALERYDALFDGEVTFTAEDSHESLGQESLR